MADQALSLPNREHDLYITGTGQRLRVHPTALCVGPCVVHSPSDHPMLDYPTHWRSDRGIMERICPHGVGHPDPDDTDPDHIHGCDFCCGPYRADQGPAQGVS